jgi:hypothetical protein
MALSLVRWIQEKNHRAYLSHRKKRLHELDRQNKWRCRVNGKQDPCPRHRAPFRGGQPCPIPQLNSALRKENNALIFTVNLKNNALFLYLIEKKAR